MNNVKIFSFVLDHWMTYCYPSYHVQYHLNENMSTMDNILANDKIAGLKKLMKRLLIQLQWIRSYSELTLLYVEDLSIHLPSTLVQTKMRLTSQWNKWLRMLLLVWIVSPWLVITIFIVGNNWIIQNIIRSVFWEKSVLSSHASIWSRDILLLRWLDIHLVKTHKTSQKYVISWLIISFACFTTRFLEQARVNGSLPICLNVVGSSLMLYQMGTLKTLNSWMERLSENQYLT